MTVITEKFNINTQGFTDIVDITKNVQNYVYKHSIKDALVVAYVGGSTASLTTIEFEPGLLTYLPAALDRIAPMNIEYAHDETWNDGNGYAHVRASIIGNSISIPLIEGALQLGTYQQVVLIDFDNKARTRTVYLQIIC